MVQMQKKHISTDNIDSDNVLKDERIVIHLDKLLAALGYNETETDHYTIPDKN